jgi:hypothetical protein
MTPDVNLSVLFASSLDWSVRFDELDTGRDVVCLFSFFNGWITVRKGSSPAAGLEGAVNIDGATGVEVVSASAITYNLATYSRNYLNQDEGYDNNIVYSQTKVFLIEGVFWMGN